MRLTIGLLMLSIALLFSSESLAQEKTNLGGYLVPMCVYNGDTIPAFQIPTIHIFKPLKFRNRKEQMEYYKLVRNVKKVYPIAREINRTIIETYEYLQTLPNKEARDRHLKLVEKGIKTEYTPRMKKLIYQQGKLLIKLIYRECNSSSYNLIQSFFGPTRAGVYQAFAWLFGASLRKGYDPNGVDRITERVVRQVESGQI